MPCFQVRAHERCTSGKKSDGPMERPQQSVPTTRQSVRREAKSRAHAENVRRILQLADKAIAQTRETQQHSENVVKILDRIPKPAGKKTTETGGDKRAKQAESGKLVPKSAKATTAPVQPTDVVDRMISGMQAAPALERPGSKRYDPTSKTNDERIADVERLVRQYGLPAGVRRPTTRREQLIFAQSATRALRHNAGKSGVKVPTLAWKDWARKVGNDRTGLVV